MMNTLLGTGIALITPFHPDGSVDYDGLSRLIDHVITGGVDYVVSLGTTGETATLTTEEKAQILRHTVETVNGRVPVIAGFGGNNTRQVIDDILQADLSGITAILSASPYYNKPTQEGIYQHYMAIATAAPIPVILYNVPGRTSSNITATTTLRLAHDHPNIIGIKEASGNLEQCMDIVKDKPDGFLVISGEDALTLPMISFGMDGVISVIGNAFPQSYSQLVQLAMQGNFSAATQLQWKLADMLKLLFVEGNPAGVKCALRHIGICGDTLRLPLVNVSKATDDRIAVAALLI